MYCTCMSIVYIYLTITAVRDSFFWYKSFVIRVPLDIACDKYMYTLCTFTQDYTYDYNYYYSTRVVALTKFVKDASAALYSM